MGKVEKEGLDLQGRKDFVFSIPFGALKNPFIFLQCGFLKIYDA
jgi:hypothetical protein